MNVRVRLFAQLRERAGAREVKLELPDGVTIEAAWSALVERFPAVSGQRSALRFARNGAYVDATETLADGDELACIPPVSGGAGEGREDAAAPETRGLAAERPRHIIEIRPGPLPATLAAELAARLATPEDGAVVVFEGRARVTPGAPAPGEEAAATLLAGLPVEALEYEAHEAMAVAVLERIADEVEARFGVERLAIVHATGRVAVGEIAVVIVASAPHRGAAFDAARMAMDETKARAPIWKAEHASGGHVWVGEPARPAASDGRGAAR
jgi:molybdopterin synthase catalytic subunit